MVIMGVTVWQDFLAGNPPWWNFTMTSRLNCLTHHMSFWKWSFLPGCFCETRCMEITFGVSGVSLQSPDLDRSSFNISQKQADDQMMLRWQNSPKSYLLHLFKWWISKLLKRSPELRKLRFYSESFSLVAGAQLLNSSTFLGQKQYCIKRNAGQLRQVL